MHPYPGAPFLRWLLGDHSHREERIFFRPVDGYVAILGDKRDKYSKYQSAAIERLLLEVAEDTDRLPAHNVAPGAASIVRLFCSAEPTLRAKVTGFDPFFHPDRAKHLHRPMEIRAHRTRDGKYDIEHDWRLRRIRRGIA
jgi:hypothetical protein